MKPQTRYALVLLSLFALAPLAAHAQGGCVNSPENPTIILGLVGTAAAALTALRNRTRR